MNRDMDAIRQIVITTKKSDSIVREIDGMPDDVFKFNAMLLIESGLALGKCNPNSSSGNPVPIAVLIFRLTWKGFDFADSIKDDDIWAKAKENILKPAGSWTFEIFTEYLKYEIKTKLGMNSSS